MGCPLAILSRVNRPSLFHPPQDGTGYIYTPSLPERLEKSFRKRVSPRLYTKPWNLFVISPMHRFILGERRWSFKGRREETENGYRGRSKILIHNPFLPQDSLCRAIYDPLSDLNYALVSSDPPLKSNAGMKGRNARESTRAMNLANRRRPRGSSTTIVHNFHRKGKGIGRPRSHFSAHESDTRTGTIRGSREFSRNFSSSLLGYVSYVLDSVRTREEAKKGREREEEWLYRSRCGNSGFTPRDN